MPKGFGSAKQGKMRQTKETRRSPFAFARELTPGTDSFPLRTGRRQGLAGKEQAYPDPPLNWEGTLPEWTIYWAHTVLGLRPGEDFEYQYMLDPGLIVDFYEYDLSMAIEVQGIYWHYMQGGFKLEDDLQRKINAQARGLDLIYIDEDDALESPVYYLREARAGRDHSRVTRGF